MQRVVCFGSAVIDILMKSKDFRVLKSHQVQGGVAMCEVYGGKMGVDEMEIATGGAGTNVSVGLSRLRIVSASVCKVGDDLFGRQIMNELSLEKVESSQVQVEERRRTGTSVVLVAADGGRSILTYRGVSKEIESGRIDWEKVGVANWIHLSGMGGNLSLVEDVINFANKKKIKLSWNPGKGELIERERIKGLLSKIEVLIVNRMEAAILLSHEYEEEEEIAKGLMGLGIKQAVVTDGRRGVMWIEQGRLLRCSAVKVESVDDTGAGDGFVAGLVAGLMRGEEIETALKMGVVSGASVVTKLGAKKGLLRWAGMERWLKRKVEVVEERW